MSIYKFEATSVAGEKVSLSQYEGKVLLVVNSATGCGFTPQYDDLEAIYESFKDKGFEVLEFPSNEFEQAPESDSEIANICSTKFGIQFPRFQKVTLNGPDAHPLFSYLAQEKGFEGFTQGHELTPILEDIISKKNPNYKEEKGIKWNFTKFLVDQKGNVVARFEPTVDMAEVSNRIHELLG